MIEVPFVEHIATALSARRPDITSEQVSAAIALLNGGATIPFVARYRKDAVGHLDETQLEFVLERSRYFTGIANRRKTILEAINKQGKLTEELRQLIEQCADRVVLEELYLPFKAKRHTKATVAEEQGLAPLADFILKQLPGLQSVEEFAEAFIRPERSISSPEEALEGARYILAERFALDAEVRALMREFILREGAICARATKNAEGGKTKYEAYYSFAEPLATLSAPRLLAVLRGEREGFLRVDVNIDDVKMFNILLDRFLTDSNSVFGAHIRLALNEAYARHLRPSIESEVLETVRKRADDEVVRICRENAWNILLTAPAGPIPVMGVLPSAVEAATIAVIDGRGGLQEHQTLVLRESADGTQAAKQALGALLDKHAIRAVVIGSGGGGRETARFVNSLLTKIPHKGVCTVLLNESPASVYATSRLAREEFPDLEPPLRAAISLGRRFQDPLAELVKIEPRSIGIGPHQYDVNQKQLREGLFNTVVACVNRVGMDANTASVSLLRYVSGMQMGTAQNLVAEREKRSGFTSRAQLTEVDGIGPKVFEQCAGFLRVSGAQNPLDATGIHPEAYPLVERIAQSLDVPVAQLIGNAELIGKVDFAAFQSDGFGPFAIEDLRNELLKPAQDPRGPFRPPRFREGLTPVENLQEGNDTEGVVTNVTEFGAFVDIGAQQDGLVHLSELSTRFVKDPHEVINVGDVVRVKVIKVDKETPRISLSIKALLVRSRRRPMPRPPAQAQPDDEARRWPLARAHGDGLPSPKKPRREGTRTRPGEDGEGRKPRAARPQRREHTRALDVEPKPERRPARPTKRAGGGGESQRVHNYGHTGSPLNTLLADQLAALRDKFKP